MVMHSLLMKQIILHHLVYLIVVVLQLVFTITKQVETRINGSLKCIKADTGEDYSIILSGRYNDVKKSLRFDEVGGGGGWFRATLNDNIIWGTGSTHAGAQKASWRVTRQ